jgi:hypothetical protein
MIQEKRKVLLFWIEGAKSTPSIWDNLKILVLYCTILFLFQTNEKHFIAENEVEEEELRSPLNIYRRTGVNEVFVHSRFQEDIH